MAIISAFNIIRSIAILHITVAYYFLTNPRQIADQNFIFMLAQSMQLPHVTDFNKPSPVTAFAAVVLAFLGISDLISVSISEPIAVEYWSAITPLRLLFLFPLTAYVYLHEPASIAGIVSKGPGTQLKNGMTFAFCFLETVMWFWVYVSMKEQRSAAAKRVLQAQTSQIR